MAFYDIQYFKTVRIEVINSIKLAKSQKEKMVPGSALKHSKADTSTYALSSPPRSACA